MRCVACGRLVSCPAGYQLVNSLDGVNGSFSHAAQNCRPCGHSQYILNPNTDTCHDCPVGATCESAQPPFLCSGFAMNENPVKRNNFLARMCAEHDSGPGQATGRAWSRW